MAEGPYQDAENTLINAFVPPAGFDPRPDATYFPIPWLLSTKGYGVLVDSDDTSRFGLDSPWRFEVDGAQAAYKVYAGPRPADVLRRFSADVGRQPPASAPFYFGPWWQPKGDAGQNIETLRKAGALGSVAQTYTHYLPCGAQQGKEADEQAKTALFHAAGLAVTTYFNPMICTTYQPPYDEAVDRSVLNTNAAGQPYVYRYTGANQFLVGQFDFTRVRARSRSTATSSARRSPTATTAGWRTSASTRPRTPTRPTARRVRRCTTATRSSTTAPRTRTRATARRGRSPASTARAGPARPRSRRSSGAATRPPASASTASQSAVRNGLSMGLSGVSPVGLGHRRLLRHLDAPDHAGPASAAGSRSASRPASCARRPTASR